MFVLTLKYIIKYVHIFKLWYLFQDEEKRLRDEHISYQEQEARRQREHQQELLRREEEAKKRVALETRDHRRLLERQKEINQQRERLMLDQLHKAFRRSENQLVSALEERKGVVKVRILYKSITF